MKKWISMGALALACGLGGFVAVTTADSRRVETVTNNLAPSTVTLPDFRVVAKRTIPAVVTVRSEKEMVHPAVPEGPLNDLFGRFFGRPPQDGEGAPERGRGPSYTQRGLGSGVIVSSDGYVLTNNHVIEGVDKIEIVTAEGTVLTGKLVGADAKSDIAVIKVEATGLTAMPLGDSATLEVGEWVLAVGNPFSERLGHTVTAGIVSAVGRSNLDIADYEEFIQTDAAVNPGNSGGALVNARGELVGINTAIVSRSGGFQGVSFAVPINLARHVMDELVSKGRVSRGYLGVGIQDIDKDLAESLKLPNTDGVLVGQVFPETPAARAGLKRGDVILALDGQKVKDVSELRNRVARLSPGSGAKLEVMRDGRRTSFDLSIAELEDQASNPGGPSAPETPARDLLGLTVQPLTPDLARRLGAEGRTGVVIAAVEPGSPAARAGLRPGDLVEEVNRQSIARPADFVNAVSAVGEGGVCLLYVRRDDNAMFVTVRK